MKNLLLFFCIGLLSISYVAGQTTADAYRYSSEELTGTARYRSMSGAFGALGGDISAISINPAGSAVFLNSFATFTLDHRNSENSVNYFNGLTTNERSDFNFSQAGGVLVFQGNSNNPWRKFTIGINFTETNNFDDNFIASGTSNSSIDEYFLGYAEGVPLDLLETVDGESVTDLYTYLGENQGFGTQQAMLGYQGYIINPESTDLDNTSYNSSVEGGSFAQNYAMASTGMNGKLSFNFATQYQDFLYLGANLNTHFLNYNSSTLFTESNNNPGSTTTYVEFENNLNTTGDGFSFQLGAIAKVNQNVRLGASYESPTWYNIREEATQYLETDNTLEGTTVVNPNTINIYPDYTLKTPGKLTGSLALLFGGSGLISFDYSYKDYTNMEFRPVNDPDFGIQNQEINDTFQATSSYRVGGEYRIQGWSLRGGYRFEESPYRDRGNLGEVTGYSGGFGYNFGSVKLDLAYNKTEFSDARELYNVGLTNAANIDRDISNFVISLSFGL
ncbi:outer membrane protein transport protein [Salegentibacter sp. F188]|uniref:Outer membrane protein transport protein n=1 Tax=Autumnicola patrickiae TaxID=3075591 RepID=A0ABU3E0D3_9FLAO|nr:outer membrane protein transport protein [Salegentibacter sp. F188]MDT0689453.1 outer membrane protein transport protein [Salegentibacter sp. F188]